MDRSIFSFSDPHAEPSTVQPPDRSPGWAGRYSGSLFAQDPKQGMGIPDFELTQQRFLVSTRRPPSSRKTHRHLHDELPTTSPSLPPVRLFSVPVSTVVDAIAGQDAEVKDAENKNEDAEVNDAENKDEDEEALKQEEVLPVKERAFLLWLSEVLPDSRTDLWLDFRDFVLEHGLQMLQKLQEKAKLGQRSMYEFGDQCLTPAFVWSSALGEVPFRWRTIQGTKCQLLLVPFYISHKLNPHFEVILDLMKSDLDLARYRTALALGPSTDGHAIDGNYVILCRDWGEQERIEAFETSGNLRDLETDAQNTVGYLGTSVSMEDRGGKIKGHRSSKDPVNARMRAERELCGQQHKNWGAKVVTRTSSSNFPQMPFQARHWVEHALITFFKFTDADEGGRNVNIVDQPAFETLISANLIASIIKGLEAVVTELPRCLLPAEHDAWAWERLLRPFLPEGTPAALSTILHACTGTSRLHVWAYTTHPRLSEYLRHRELGRAFDAVRARSEEHRVSQGRPASDYYLSQRTSLQVLEAMEKIMVGVAGGDVGTSSVADT